MNIDEIHVMLCHEGRPTCERCVQIMADAEEEIRQHRAQCNDPDCLCRKPAEEQP